MNEQGALGNPERVPATPEKSEHQFEQPVEVVPNTESSVTEVGPLVMPVTPTAAPAPTAPASGISAQRLEQVLSAGMEDAYRAMDPATQQKFKSVGEDTAATISRMLSQAKIHVEKIVQVILAWLRIIPRVNPFYLEQEAKIKTDAILALHRQSQSMHNEP